MSDEDKPAEPRDQYRRARESLNEGNFASAERLSRACLAHPSEGLADFPRYYDTLLILAQSLEGLGRIDEALDIYGHAARARPGDAFHFTRRAILRFRRAFGPPPQPRPPASENRIAMTNLGANGRFGNQLLQYGFLRLYAAEHGLVAEVPDWIGRDLYDLDDPYPGSTLPILHEDSADLIGSLRRESPTVYSNADLNGYFGTYHRGLGNKREAFRNLYRPGKRVASRLDDALRLVRVHGKTLVAIHLRVTDFGYGEFWVAPASWYRRWLEPLWSTLDSPMLYVATDDAERARTEFARFKPLIASDLGIAIDGADFIIDHYLMSQADFLATANSSFSYTAALLNCGADRFFRPDPDRREIVRFNPWESELSLHPSRPNPDATPEEEFFIRQYVHPQYTIAHVGEYCTPWTNLTRTVHPLLSVHEIEAIDSLDRMRLTKGLRHLNVVAIESADALPEVLDRARDTLQHARADMFVFRIPDRPRVSEPSSFHLFPEAGYRIFRLSPPDLIPVANPPVLSHGVYVALHERLVPLFFGQPPTMLDLPALCRAHHVVPRGVIHVGAHEGQEMGTYGTMSGPRLLMIEANPAVFARLQRTAAGYCNVTCVNRAITDRPGPVALNIASADQSSSILPFGLHQLIYPDIRQVNTIEVTGTTLDGLLDELGLDPEEFNLLNIDIQGAEALALRGAMRALRFTDAINIELNFAELYQGCAQIEDIEAILCPIGFRRVALTSPFHSSWGDGFYVRDPKRAVASRP